MTLLPRSFGRTRLRLVVLGALLGALGGSASPARAERNNYYAYTDAQGVLHVTNVPNRRQGNWSLYKTLEGSGGDDVARGRASAHAGRAPVRLESERLHRYDSIIRAAAQRYQLPESLLRAVIHTESNYYAHAVSRAGAMGLMQLMPKTAKSLGRALGRPARIYDARFNVHAGTYYLSRLLDKFDGDEALALASYVRGPSRVRAWVDEGQPFPDGVQGFVDKVQQARAVFVALGWPEPPSDADTGGSAKVSGDDDAPTSAAPR